MLLRVPACGVRRIREGRVVDLIVVVHVVADQRDRAIGRAAGDRGQRDVYDIIAEAPPVGPSAGICVPEPLAIVSPPMKLKRLKPASPEAWVAPVVVSTRITSGI